MKVIAVAAVSVAIVAPAVAFREDVFQAAQRTRELIEYRAYGIGTLISNFPETSPDLAIPSGLPFGLQEYYAPFPVNSTSDEGDLLLLAMPVSKIYSNAMPPNKPNLTMSVADLYGLGDGNLAAGRARVALFGTLERLDGDGYKEAYLKEHYDARGWVGPRGPHSAFFARFRVTQVYFFGGFGDVAYIGWIPLDLYRSTELRSQKESRKAWPEPKQPEDSGLWAAEGLFTETVQTNAETGQFVVQA